jgi:hypothetical protein
MGCTATPEDVVCEKKSWGRSPSPSMVAGAPSRSERWIRERDRWRAAGGESSAVVEWAV